MIHVIALMESHSVGGPAKNLIEFARRAREPRAERPAVALELVTFRRGTPSAESPFVEAARKAGIPVHLLTERRRFDLGTVAQLRALAARLDPDIIQTHNMKSHLLMRLAGLGRRYPWIAFQHGYTQVDWKDRLYRYSDWYSLRAAYRVVAVCRAFTPRLERMGVARERIRVRHNSVDPFEPPPPERITELRTRFGIPEGVPVMVSVGRLSKEKGHADLIEALAPLGGRRPELAWRLLIVGDGPERASLERMCRERGLEARVRFAGHQSDVRPYYGLAAMLALPSHSEGSPNVVLEAMAAGLPVVGAAVGGVPEIVADHVTGLLAPPRNPAALAGALERLLEDPGLAARMGAAATAVVEKQYSREAYCEANIGLYREVLESYGAT